MVCAQFPVENSWRMELKSSMVGSPEVLLNRYFKQMAALGSSAGDLREIDADGVL